MSRLTQSAKAQLCGQLYFIRAAAARKIYLPKDLSACEDGFIKTLVCTDRLAHPNRADRIVLAPQAEHTFEAYTSFAAVFRNQKRQIIGQTMVHLLIDRFLAEWPAQDKENIGERLRELDGRRPGWLKQLVAAHLASTRRPWQLYPKLATQRLEHWRTLSGFRRVMLFPAALAGTAMTLAASYAAAKHLKSGCLNYWPKAARTNAAASEAKKPHTTLAAVGGPVPGNS